MFTFVLVAAGWEPVCAAACAWCAPAEGLICLYRQSCPYLPPPENPARGCGLPQRRGGHVPRGLARGGRAIHAASEAAHGSLYRVSLFVSLLTNYRTLPPPSDALLRRGTSRKMRGSNAGADGNATLM